MGQAQLDGPLVLKAAGLPAESVKLHPVLLVVCLLKDGRGVGLISCP